MPAPILVAGLDARSLVLEAPLLRREQHPLVEQPGGHALLRQLATGGAALVVLGSQLPDLPVEEVVRRVRGDVLLRTVSLLVILAAGAPPTADAECREAGANAVLRRPLQVGVLESWLSKLLDVERRSELRVRVQGQVMGSPAESVAFVAVTRNVSNSGMLLATTERLPLGRDVEIELSLPEVPHARLLGRVVREAREVAWPYLGYGVELLLVPAEVEAALLRLARNQSQRPSPGAEGIHSTLRKDAWVYEIRNPVRDAYGWQVEIRRAPRERYRPSAAGPFYVVQGRSPEAALEEARAFIRRH
jgi:CheY-like chemotaxis protein